MRALVLDIWTVNRAVMGQVLPDFGRGHIELPSSDEETKCVEINGIGYMVSRAWQADDPALVVSLDDEKSFPILAPQNRAEAFARILRMSKGAFERGGAIPVQWRPFHANRFVSFQSNRRNSGETARIALESNAQDTGWVYAFWVDRRGTRDLANAQPDYDIFVEAYSGIKSAAAYREEGERSHSQDAVTLSRKLRRAGASELSYKDWIARRLTREQQDFVERPLTSSVRLVGPAGSGKTVALVVKCLKEIEDSKGAKRFLFLTHALSTVEQVELLMQGMDTEGIVSSSPSRPLTITTLYALANSVMHYDLYGLTPVSLDGHDGRAFQADVIDMALKEFIDTDWVTFRAACSAPFARYIESVPGTNEHRFFVWELMNEFACVLDADGVRSAAERQASYLGEKRKTWMMPMAYKVEREVVLNLYNRFRDHLLSMKAIGVDQMTSDFLNFLDSYRWEALRNTDGYDAVFVDELHLFNRLEKMTFRHLLRSPAKAPVVLMAYDAKQSPRDTFLGMSEGAAEKYNFWRDAKLGHVEKFEFLDVFRYTPEITRALSFIDKSFPGHDFLEEWPAFRGIARTASGPIPTLTEFGTSADLYNFVFGRARDMQRQLGQKGRVAVLCASEELFGIYAEAGTYRDSFTAITSRDELTLLNHAPKRFIFSTPEYVAGLQFHAVLLIEVNRDAVPEGPYGASATRKFASLIYLGASRAERCLEIYATKEHAGASPILALAVDNGAIKPTAPRDLPS
jgi:hypothetical protein